MCSHQELVRASLQQFGHLLMTAILTSATHLLPRELLRQCAAVVYGLIRDVGSISSQWLLSVVCNDEFLQKKAGRIEAKEVQLFCEIALKQPQMLRPRFEALFTDFCAVCRGEGNADVLLGYQM